MFDTITDRQQKFKATKDIPVIISNRSDTILSEGLQGDATEIVADFDIPKIQVDVWPLVSKPKLT